MNITLDLNKLTYLRKVDPMLTSYNVEMTEVTGGTFWRSYTPGQVAGTEPFVAGTSFDTMMEYFPAIDLYHEKLRKLAKAIGPQWIRVSGSWATKTYYDFDGATGGIAPEGFQSVLTKEQWIGVLDFVKFIGGKLLISMANCPGIHSREEEIKLDQAKLIFDFSKEYGVPVDAVEFVNEPNYIDITGFPKGYTVEDYGRDFDIFARWLRENYPEVLLVGPSSATTEKGIHPILDDSGKYVRMAPTTDMLNACKETCDIFSYHYYNGTSERGAAAGGHWPVEMATSEDYLSVAECAVRYYLKMSAKYIPGSPLWVTESGDAACGGNTWGSTYLDVIRSANELGIFTKLTDGIIFHNTLASSDYGWLDHHSFDPRPNYFLILLWNQLVGDKVYNSGIEIQEGAHVYAFSRKDGKDGAVYLVINNSMAESTTVELPGSAEIYVLTGNGSLRSSTMCLNGKELVLDENSDLPALDGITVSAGKLEVAPGSCAFIVL